MSTIYGAVGPIDVVGDDRRLSTARRHYTEMPRAELEHVGRGLVADKGSGILFEIVRSEVLEAMYPESVEGITAFFVEDDQPVFVRRAGTIDEWQQQQAAEQQEQARERERERAAHEAFIKAQPQRVVTLGEVEGIAYPSLREAAAQVLSAGGRIEARDGRLLVSLPERVARRLGRWRPTCADRCSAAPGFSTRLRTSWPRRSTVPAASRSIRVACPTGT